MTFVIAAAEIDLSIGALAGLASVVTALAIQQYGILAGIAAGLLVGRVIDGELDLTPYLGGRRDRSVR